MKLNQTEVKSLAQIKQVSNRIDKMNRPNNKDIQHKMDELNTSIYHICMSDPKAFDRCGYFFADHGVTDRYAMKAILPKHVDSNMELPKSTRDFDKHLKQSLNKTKKFGTDWVQVKDNGSFNLLTYKTLRSLSHKMNTEMKKDIEMSHKPAKQKMLKQNKSNPLIKDINFSTDTNQEKPSHKQKVAMEHSQQGMER